MNNKEKLIERIKGLGFFERLGMITIGLTTILDGLSIIVTLGFFETNLAIKLMRFYLAVEKEIKNM